MARLLWIVRATLVSPRGTIVVVGVSHALRAGYVEIVDALIESGANASSSSVAVGYSAYTATLMAAVRANACPISCLVLLTRLRLQASSGQTQRIRGILAVHRNEVCGVTAAPSHLFMSCQR